MTHRSSKWFREAIESKPLYRLTCNKCGEAMLTYDPELAKAAHQTAHFGHPWDFALRKEQEGARADG